MKKKSTSREFTVRLPLPMSIIAGFKASRRSAAAKELDAARNQVADALTRLARAVERMPKNSMRIIRNEDQGRSGPRRVKP